MLSSASPSLIWVLRVFYVWQQPIPKSGDGGEVKKAYNEAVAALDDAKEACARGSLGKHYDLFDILTLHLGEESTSSAKGLVFKTTVPARDSGNLQPRMDR